MRSEEHSMQDIQEHWNRKYEEGLPSLTRPDPFFLYVYKNLISSRYPSQGRALDLAVLADTA